MYEVYKIGLANYIKKVDKNSGLTEYNIVCDKLKEANDFGKKVLVILNGKSTKEDDDLLDKMKEYDVRIFLMSDSIAIKDNLEIVNDCDYCLHQAPNYIFREIKCKQGYNYVPELFYGYVEKNFGAIGSKIPKVFFGGNNLNRNDKFELYNIGDSDIIDCVYKKYESGEDTRLSHQDYLRELSAYKYSLVICREEYRNNSWLTSRLFEAIALNNLPIMDIDYDTNNNIGLMSKECFYKSNDEGSLRYIVGFYEDNPHAYFSTLMKLKSMAGERQKRFIENIESLVVK